MKLDFERMWETAKEEFAKYPEPEALAMLEQIEEQEASEEDPIEKLILEVINIKISSRK